MNKKFSVNWIYLILALGIFNSLFFIYGHRLVVDSFQLLDRAFLLTEGYLVPFGPRSTNTNMIYGPLVSVFSAIPYALTKSPISIAFFVLLSQVFGFLLLAKTRFLSNDKNFLIVFLALYWLSPWRASEAFIWNASLLFFTASLYIYSLDYLKRKNNEANFLGTIIHGFAYMLTLQIHNSVLFFAPVTLYFWYKKDIRLNFKAIGVCILFFIAMFFPTAYVIYHNPEVLSVNTSDKAHLFSNLLSVGEMIKGGAYWLRYPSLYFGSTIFQLPKYDWSTLDFLNKAWIVIKWIMAIGSILIVIFANKEFIKKAPNEFLKKIVYVSFFSLIFISAISPVPFNFWHLYLLYPFTLIPVAWFLSQHKKKYVFLIFLGSYFSIYSFIEASHSYKHDFSYDNDLLFKSRVLDRKEYLLEKYEKLMIKLF